MKRLILIYVAFYLLVGGVGLSFAPDLSLRLFWSNGAYGDVMPRVVGMFMLALGAFVLEFVRRNDVSYFPTSAYVRALIVAFMIFLYAKSTDPLFLVLVAIVLVGLVPSIYVLSRERFSK